LARTSSIQQRRPRNDARIRQTRQLSSRLVRHRQAPRPCFRTIATDREIQGTLSAGSPTTILAKGKWPRDVARGRILHTGYVHLTWQATVL
jgi:hypothetical protein